VADELGAADGRAGSEDVTIGGAVDQAGASKRTDVGHDVEGEITGTALPPVYQALSAWNPDLG
jgi:hypothetical protein